MDDVPPIAAVASLIAEPARAKMLSALMAGQPMSATELALYARVTPQTVSGHLAALRENNLVIKDKRGRSHYYKLGGPAVAAALEALEVLAAEGLQPGWRPTLESEPIRIARMCYDHLAGKLGVALTETMVRRRYLEPSGKDFRLTPAGERFCAKWGLDLSGVWSLRRRFARQCLDWSERRPHLAGSLAAAFATRCFELDWLRRMPGTRALRVTKKGRTYFRKIFSIRISCGMKGASDD